MICRLAAAVVTLAFVVSMADAQQIATRALTLPSARSSEAFTDIVGAQELADGRVLVADRRDNRIALVDFARQRVTNVSRVGPGPLEYDGAFALVSWLGDTVLVYGRRTLLKISPEGAPVARVEALTPATAGGGTSPPRFSDRMGRLYHEVTPPLERNPDGSFIPPIRGPVLRWNPRNGSVDTAAWIVHRDPKQPLVRPWRPYPAKDGVAVLPDGRVLVVKAQDYHLEVWRDGKLLMRGPTIDVPRLPVTTAERNAFRDERARQPAGSLSMPRPQQPASESERTAARRRVGVPDEAFPPALPPIVESEPTPVDADGLIWVARSYRATDSNRHYDIFNDRGDLVERVTLPNRGRVIGFGRGAVYVTSLDDDDLQWIERHEMPARAH
jgi:hypothetical protein